jgi:hypothetical protein
MGRAVELLPCRGVGQPEVSPAVDDDRLSAELLGQGGGVPVRQPEEDHVVAGQHVDGGGVQHPAGQRQQVRMVFGDGGPGAGGSGQRTDGQPPVGVRRMAEQQAQDLSTGISAGTGDRDRRHAAILHGYASGCKLIKRWVYSRPPLIL